MSKYSPKSCELVGGPNDGLTLKLTDDMYRSRTIVTEQKGAIPFPFLNSKEALEKEMWRRPRRAWYAIDYDAKPLKAYFIVGL